MAATDRGFLGEDPDTYIHGIEAKSMKRRGEARYTFHSRSAFSNLHSYGFKQRSKDQDTQRTGDTHPNVPSHFAAQVKPEAQNRPCEKEDFLDLAGVG